ncbi:t22.11 [Tupaiid betaherpesvirus 1]|uniref:T22.11 n=1 Tax=Tupaiid herpesvirus 1 (strain 1) TaxID=10397 RepID=Q91TS8_TUHV1|nr:t22.11 [Tupaiid betaherpesvirus 1]AAK57059.1 t22.11 [Tupaiid betaherpesvirus 1]
MCLEPWWTPPANNEWLDTGEIVTSPLMSVYDSTHAVLRRLWRDFSIELQYGSPPPVCGGVNLDGFYNRPRFTRVGISSLHRRFTYLALQRYYGYGSDTEWLAATSALVGRVSHNVDLNREQLRSVLATLNLSTL